MIEELLTKLYMSHVVNLLNETYFLFLSNYKNSNGQIVILVCQIRRSILLFIGKELECPLLGCNAALRCYEVDDDQDGCGDWCECPGKSLFVISHILKLSDLL